jgi:RNA polymerase sigma-70 factor (ECF subfamily)
MAAVDSNETDGAPAADTSRNRGDAELIRAARAGDHEAFRELVRRYQRPVFACAWSIVRHAADAADVCQETFIRFHRNLDQCDSRRPLKPYLLTMACNCARNFRRDRDRSRQEMAGEEAAAAVQRVADCRPGPARQAMIGEKRAAVQRLVARLPETLRDVCSLFYLSGRDCREVAGLLSMSEAAVKVALHRARKRLLESGAREWRAT